MLFLTVVASALSVILFWFAASSYGQLLALLAAAFSQALSAYPYACRQFGWKHGELFDGNNMVPMYVAASTIAILLGAFIAALVNGLVNAWFILFLVAAYFVAGTALTHILKAHGFVLIVIAPLSAIASIIIGW